MAQNRSSVSRYTEGVGFEGMELKCNVWKLPLYADHTALFVSVNTAELEALFPEPGRAHREYEDVNSAGSLNKSRLLTLGLMIFSGN